ncbi:MAG: Rieske 2Fe-2S domain-containing protein [Burkholderiales bacterium]|nr:Rieske 2Fe-2S domain-containing protein [Burkholderiales bacterium]
MDRQPGFDPLSWAVQDDRARGVFRVNRRAFVDAQVLELERRHIFERCWLYVGHESEVASPGRFVSRNVGGKPILMNRDSGGRINVFFNACMHRGAQVCRETSGQARNFTCPYHGWVYGDDGALRHQPIPESYSAACNANGELDLKRVPKSASYCGFVFLNFDAGAQSLEDYLAGAREYLELASLHGEKGMTVLPGSQSYSARANWKLLQENSADGYHADTTHASYFDYIKSREGAVKNLYAAKGFGRVRNLGNGHSVSESLNGTPWGRPTARWMPSWSESLRGALEDVHRRMIDRLGEEKATFICHGDRNLLIFPNLVVNDVTALTIRTFYPLAPDYFEISAWGLAPIDEAPALRDLRMRNYLEFLGPGGFATPDDQEMLESCQRGYAAMGGADWNDLSRGMASEDGPNPAKQDELQMRTFWRRWKSLLADGSRVAA